MTIERRLRQSFGWNIGLSEAGLLCISTALLGYGLLLMPLLALAYWGYFAGMQERWQEWRRN